VRFFATISALVALAAGAYFFAASANDEGPASTQVRTVERQAAEAAATANLQAAATELENFMAANGTYQGATLTAADDVVLVRADAAAYCIETGVGAAVEHEAGPGGSPQPGAC
jgi:hypothetical protein